MPNGKRPTITDVAAVAGVGASTVSRYVRHAKSVSPRMVDRIEQAIARLGYEPNILARGLRIGRTRVLGVLVPHVANVFYSAAVRAIENEARERGFTVLLLTHHEDQRSQDSQLSVLKQFQCDGIILIPAAGTEAQRVFELVGSTPLVALDRPLGKRWDSFTLDNYAATKQATQHLLWHGHKRIIAVTAPYRLDTLEQRQQGYRDALKAARLDPQVITSRTPDQLRADLLAALSSNGSLPPAVLSLSYTITISVLHALRDCGLSLRETPLVAIDDLEFATLVDPPLTTLAQPAERLGSLSVNRLFARMNDDPDTIAHSKIGGQLIIRESCGCNRTAPAQEHPIAAPRLSKRLIRQAPA
ncbi:MAG TPA: LacI family DNA-binding transcriptional regulator [Acidobacteriaceae bacterium]|jgi:LacI family transcriptional regulator|nr:LacI family DNA-binding transcriptional regulator [Acidobacteriaceae bacterium]